MTETTVAPATASETSPAGLPAVRLAGLTKRFGSVLAVDGLDLTIQAGEVVAFLGPNGAGKTTTIDLLLGLSHPDEGNAEIYGLAPRTAIAHGLVAAVVQTGGLLKDLTVAETVRLTAGLLAYSRPVAEVLKRAGIAELADRQVGKCSGGQQQRLRFAMALLPEPELLVLDEPTTGMDVEGRRDFWTAIRADAERGRTVLFATHYLEEADAYADRVVLVARGRVVADGTASEIRALSAGRLITATLPDVHDHLDTLRALPGVENVEQRGTTVLVHSADSDVVARHLLTRTDAHDLQISSRGLEDAFLALTSSPASADHPTGAHR